MKIGHSEIFALETGMFKLDGGAMFGTVPKPIWEKAIPPDEQNRIPMALRIILLRDFKTKRNLLIDTGIGTKWPEKLATIYGIDHSKFTLQKALSEHDLKPEDITDVILTHLHFDHAGGATLPESEGAALLGEGHAAKFKPTFPNAKYYIQKDNLDWAMDPNSREAASYLPENFKPLIESKKLIVCDGIEDFEKKINWPGVSVRLSYGHTIGLQCPLINLDGKIFFYPSDMIPTASHLPVPWVMGYDIHVIKLLEEKEILLAEAVKDNWIFVYEHDPVLPATTVIKGSKHYSRGDLVNLA
ncbi:MAG: MBL fold metallo-hydrolase [Deltaproteobacteria bacterium]|nr:MBL fold metallo-hydrolase [Deltaproteobacteria bacterium]